MRKRSRWVLLLLAPMAVGLVFNGCGDDSDEGAAPTATAMPTVAPTVVPLTSAQVLQPGSHGVGVTTTTFVDTSRPTMANGSFPGAPTRTLTTEIWYPTAPDTTGSENEQRDAPLAAEGRPYPLVIYSHGFMSMRRGGAYLARHLAGHGYVVASPDYPLTNAGAPGGPNAADLANQPGDVSFLIDQLLGLSGDAHSVLAGGIDPARIGLTGLSLGGSTTFLAAFHPTLRDRRVRAAAPMAGVACFLGKDFYGETKLPLLILHGDIDAIVPYRQNAVFAFGEANAPKYLVTILGGNHTSFADGLDVVGANANNLDDLGCRALTGSSEDSGGSFPDLLGGPAAGIIAGDCPSACSGPRPLPRSIRPAQQHTLTILSIFPFFEATLRDSLSAQQFLESKLASENPDVTVQFER